MKLKTILNAASIYQYSLLSLLVVGLLLLNSTKSFAQEIKFESKTIDYGSLEKGADGIRQFTFTNVGKAPLIIDTAVGSCGCTVPIWPKEPILPGESAEVKVKYDTRRVGSFTKYITLTTNDIKTKNTRLSIMGTIVAEAEATPTKENTVFNNN